MTDDSLTPQDASAGTRRIPLLTNVLKAEYRCPICNVVVVSMQDGVVLFSPSHVSQGKDEKGNGLLFIYHQEADQVPGNVPEFHPPHPIARPTEKGPLHLDSGDFHPPHTVERPE